MKTSNLLLAACGLLAGCAVGPDYQTPDSALPEPDIELIEAWIANGAEDN